MMEDTVRTCEGVQQMQNMQQMQQMQQIQQMQYATLLMIAHKLLARP